MLTTPEQSVLISNYLMSGNTTLLDLTPTLILNSRQSKTPTGNDPWVRSTIDAVKYCVRSNFPVIASTGMNTWELGLWATGEYEGSAIIICPLKPDERSDEIIDRISFDFGLSRENQLWIFVPVDRSSRGSKSWWRERDRLAFELAGRIIPISVNPQGNLAPSLNPDALPKIEIVENFKVRHKSRSGSRLKINIPENCKPFDNWHYLTHWTKRSYKPWPGEKSSDFYHALAESGDEYPRQAKHTLENILRTSLLRGSSDHIRGENSVTAFTSLSPPDSLPLMKWRRRFVKPTFEPYGIAINFRAAFRYGVRPVTYIDSSEVTVNTPEFFQGYGTGDWPKEKEWRAVGDVDLAKFSHDEVVVLVPTENDMEEIRSVTGFKVVSLCGG